MSSPPHPFSVGTYAAWHVGAFPDDDPLAARLDEIRNGLKQTAREPLRLLAQVLTYVVNYARNEFNSAASASIDYQVPLSNALTSKQESAYEALFKGTDSIMNKLWRRNQSSAHVHLGNLAQQVTDLVRTDISATTLEGAAYLADRMNALPGIIYEPTLKEAYEEAIASIEFGPEMKMESGYFAYHGLVRFRTGLTVEVQIYSELMRHWRRLSHTLYERARVDPITTHKFNSKESRLISLGHLLHLAECQLQQLEQEFRHR